MSTSLPPGTRLGRYKISSQLGIGGRGEDYLAQDTEHDRQIALKILSADVAANHSNYPTAHHWYNIYLRATGRFGEERAAAKRAQELDHLSLVISGNLAYSHLVKGDLDSVIEQSRKMVELDSNFPSAHKYLGVAYLKQGHQ